MPPPKSPPRDPLEVAIEEALEPGQFIEERNEGRFVTRLEHAAKPIAALIEADAARAVLLYEAFLAGCHEKVEEVHWEWLFGDFVRGLWRAWLRARQAAGADPDETARRLLARMEDDPYCLAYDRKVEAVKVMGPELLAAFERATRERFAELAGDTTGAARVKDPEGARRRRGEILRKILVQRGDVEAYVALCEDSEFEPDDHLALATLLRSKRRPAEALEWVDRGLAVVTKWRSMGSVGSDLVKLRRELLAKVGRGAEAVADAWKAYCSHVSQFTYGELMQLVPRADHAAWHTKAMDTARELADLDEALDLWLETKEYALLVERVGRASDRELEGLGHYLNDRVAAYLDGPYPALAARVYRALGMRILVAGKSKYYEAAFQNFADARRCYLAAGLEGQWNALVLAVRGAHSRKTGFMAGFERVAGGGVREQDASFLERARARWFPDGS